MNTFGCIDDETFTSLTEWVMTRHPDRQLTVMDKIILYLEDLDPRTLEETIRNPSWREIERKAFAYHWL